MLRLVIVLIVVAVAAAENFDGFTIGQLEAKLADYHTRLNDIMPDAVSPPTLTADNENARVRLSADGDILLQRRQDTLSTGDKIESLSNQFQLFRAHAAGIAAQESFNATLMAVNTMNAQFDEFVKDTNERITKMTSNHDAAIRVFGEEHSGDIRLLNESLDRSIAKTRRDLDASFVAFSDVVESNLTLVIQKASSVAAAVAAITTQADNTKVYLVGWKQCDQPNVGSGADVSDRSYMYCDFVKKETDTVVEITFQGSQRQINGNSIWKLRVDGRVCRTKENNAAGDLWWRLHGSQSTDLHRPVHIKGVCARKDTGAITPGKHRVTVYQEYVTSDSYYGWETSSRIIVKEIRLDQSLTTTAQPGSNGRDW